MSQSKVKQSKIEELFTHLRTLGAAETPSEAHVSSAVSFVQNKFIREGISSIDAEFNWTHTAYLKALSSPDPLVREGLFNAMSIAFTFAGSPSYVMFALFCKISPEKGHFIGELSNTQEIQEWVANKLNLDPSKVSVHLSTLIESAYSTYPKVLWTLHHLIQAFSGKTSKTPAVPISEDPEFNSTDVVYPLFIKVDTDSLSTPIDLSLYSINEDTPAIPAEYFLNGDATPHKAQLIPIEFTSAWAAIRLFPFYQHALIAERSVMRFIDENPNKPITVWLGTLPSTDFDVLVAWTTLQGESPVKDDKGTWVYKGTDLLFAADVISEYLSLKFTGVSVEILTAPNAN